MRVHGYVPDLDPFLASASVSIVPLRVGGGTRLKILNALAHGIPTVSTTIGAEGLDLEDGRDLLLADDPETFAHQVAVLLSDEDQRARLRANGRRSVESRYSWQALAPSARGRHQQGPTARSLHERFAVTARQGGARRP